MFDWMMTPQRKPHNQRGDEMYRREMEDRAALLYRLGYSAKLCKARLAANVAWDFELHGRPRHAADIDKIETPSTGAVDAPAAPPRSEKEILMKNLTVVVLAVASLLGGCGISEDIYNAKVAEL